MDSILPEYPIKELPSRFVGYPDGVEIYAKPYTYGAALNIQMVGPNNINTLSEILSGVRVEGMPKNLLTPQDILFIGLYRNLMSSMHNKINIDSVCPKCLADNRTVQTLGAIKFKTIDDFDKDVYPLEADFDKYTMWFNFVTYKDFEFCMAKYRGNKLNQLALQVVKYKNKETGELIEKPAYNAKTGKATDTALIEKYVKEVRDILFQFVDEDRDTLDEVVDILEDYGLKPIEVVCSDKKCEHKYTVNIDDKGVLVTPFREVEKSPRNRIKLRKSDIDRPDNSEENEPQGSRHAIDDDTRTKSQKRKQLEQNQIEYFDK